MTVTEAMRWHITKNGEAAICKATERACPLGGAKHFDNAQDAALYLAEQQILSQEPWAETIPRTLTKGPRKRETEETIKSFTRDSGHWSEYGYMDEDDAWDTAEILAHREGVKANGEMADALMIWTGHEVSESRKAEALDTLTRLLPRTMTVLGYVATPSEDDDDDAVNETPTYDQSWLDAMAKDDSYAATLEPLRAVVARQAVVPQWLQKNVDELGLDKQVRVLSRNLPFGNYLMALDWD